MVFRWRIDNLQRSGIRRPRLFLFAAGITFLWMTVMGAYLIAPRVSTDRYGLYWPDIAGWMYSILLCAPIVLPLASAVTFVYGMGSTKWFVQAVGFLAGAGALLMCVASYMPLWSAIMIGGVFEGSVLAEASTDNRLYRVRSAAYGDPGVYVLSLFECQPVRWWCRQVGSMSRVGDSIVEDGDRVVIEFPAKGEVTVAVNGEWKLRVIDGLSTCQEQQGVVCR